MGLFINLICSIVWVSTMKVLCQNDVGLTESFIQFAVEEGFKNLLQEPRDEMVILKEYDFIIVGAGTAGCTLANRLTEVPDWKVLLIEAGSEENFMMDIPIFANLWQFFDANWKYRTQPSNTSCLAMENRQCHWPRGKVMGGSSVLNYMIFTRGNQKDFDGWEDLGNKGWGWNDVLHYYRKMEAMKIPEFSENHLFHSTEGYLSITNPPFRTQIADAFVEAGRFMGQPTVDYNGPTQTGFNYLQVTMNNGTRHSSVRAYLHPINSRKNLHVKKKSLVTKILIDPKTKVAYGVEFMHRNRKFSVKAKKEVIVSAGTINSPQLLMLSGIGPKQHLRQKKIKVIKDAKVGYNLQDHIATGGLTYIIDYPYSLNFNRIFDNKKVLSNYLSNRNGPLSIPGGCEAIAFLDTNNMNSTDGYPDVELLMVGGSLATEPTIRKDYNLQEKIYKEMYESIQKKDSFMILPLILRPKSMGRIMLQDNNPFHHPLIYPNYFSDLEGYDMKMAIAGIRKANEVIKTPPFQKLGTKLHDKPLSECKHHGFDTDAYWECYVRYFTFTIYHHVGTCKMGPASDPYAVVDERLRVRGIQNLRVIDASIMPVVPAAHTNGPVYMIAEKGADMIKEDWKFENSTLRSNKIRRDSA